MSIDRKRRIFRPSLLSSLRMSMPSRGMALTVLVGGLIVIGGAWLALQPSQAPASTAPLGHLAAGPGLARVIDGETLVLGDRTVQLAGVRSAGRGEVCAGTGGIRFDCGGAAANALFGLVRDTAVDCAISGAGQSGRPQAVCSARGQEINQAMVAGGWARAEPGRAALEAAETRARSERRGLWGSQWGDL